AAPSPSAGRAAFRPVSISKAARAARLSAPLSRWTRRRKAARICAGAQSGPTCSWSAAQAFRSCAKFSERPAIFVLRIGRGIELVQKIAQCLAMTLDRFGLTQGQGFLEAIEQMVEVSA